MHGGKDRESDHRSDADNSGLAKLAGEKAAIIHGLASWSGCANVFAKAVPRLQVHDYQR